MSAAGPIESLLCVAATPGEAKALLATLMAAGIPGRTDGDALADEYAASMRLMNLLGCKVYVPTASLAQARAITAPASVDVDELTRQALAAERPETPPPASAPLRLAAVSPRTGTRGLLLLLYGLPLLAALVAAALR
jgi:hypothetical protein